MELLAAAWAALLAWAGEWPGVSIHSDAMTAVNAARGTMDTSCPARAVADGAFRIARATCGASIGHVKGHEGAPWNELCDHLAKAAAREPSRLAGTRDGRLAGLLAAEISWQWE
eukprot:9087255-Lingulodinium_polyedra.AAC.1